MDTIRKGGWPFLIAAWIVAIGLLVPGCGGRVNQFGNDGYMGITDANPNLPTSPNYHTYAQDHKLMLQVFGRFPQVGHVTLINNGPVIYAQVATKQKLSAAKQKELREQLAKALRFQVPRYRYQIAFM